MRTVALLTGLVTTAGFAAGSVVLAGSSPAAAASTGLAFNALSSPVRIADTRSGATDPSTYAGKTLASGGSLTVDIPTTDVPAGSGAIVAQLTAISPSAAGYLTIYPAGTTTPTVASLNFTTGQTVGNQVTVGLGTDSSTGNQAVTVYNGSTTGTADFALDLYGYYGPTGDTYTALTPARICDTRAGNPSGLSGNPAQCNGTSNAGNTLGPNQYLEFTVAGVGGVPSTGVAAVQLNVAVTNTTAASYIQCYPGGSPPPSSTPTVNQNWVAGETLSTKALVGLGSGSNAGEVSCYNLAGNADIIVDVDGYFSSSTSGDLFTPLSSPVRLCDTRTTTTGCTGGQVAAGNSVNVPVAGASGIPSTADAGVLNVTDVQPAAANFLTAYPSGITAPTATDVNYTSGDTYNVVGNASYAKVGSNSDVAVLNGGTPGGPTNVVVDAFGYFAPPSVVAVAVTAVPSSVAANGTSTSAIAVTVTKNGTPLSGDTVTLSTSGSPSAACGTLSPTTGTTNAAGQVTSTYTSSTTGGTCTVTATESQNSQSGSATITQSASGVTVTATPASIVANGTSTSTVTATVVKNGAPVGSDLVAFTTSGSPAAACGTLSATSGSTNASGQITVTYTSSTTAGTCTITATEANNAQTGSATITQTAPLDMVSVSASPPSVLANGTTASTITVTVTNTAGNVSGDAVTLTDAASPAGACGTLTPTSGTTTAGGTVTAAYISSTTVGFCTITATESQTGASGTGTVTQTATTPNTVTVTASPTSVAANGTSTSTITATVAGPVSGDLVMFSGTASPAGACGTFSPTTATTDASGVATTTYTASTTAGTCTVKATESTGGGSNTTTVTQTVAPNIVTVSPSPTSLAANGTSTSTITVTVKNFAGTPVSGDTVTLGIAPTPANACGTLTPTPGSTNGSGQVTATYVSSTTSGFCTITATETGGATGTATVTQTSSPTPADTPYAVTVVASPTTVPADGATPSTLTVTVKNTAGTAVSGDPVTLSESPPASTVSSPTSCGTLSPTTGTTNAAGQVTGITYTASTTAGTCTITATEANDAQTGSTSITQTTVVNTVTVTATPTSIAANGTSTSSISVTVTSPVGALAGDTLTLSEAPSPSGACGTLGTTSFTAPGATGTTWTVNAPNPATTYLSSTTSGFCTITATESKTGGHGSTSIDQTSTVLGTDSVAITSTPSPATVSADGTSTVTVTATVTNTPFGAVSGDQVLFSGTASPAGACGTFSPTIAPTNASGVATTTYTASKTAGTCTVKATEARANVSSSNLVVTQTPVPNTIAVTASPTSIKADGVSTSTVTVTVTNNGSPVASDSLILTERTVGQTDCGAVPATGSTNGSGVFMFTYVSSTSVGFCGITVTDSSDSRTDTATVTSASDSVTDASITAADHGKPVIGAGIPPGTYVGTVTAGTSFLLSSSPTSQVNVNATANGTSVTIIYASGSVTITQTS